MSYYISKLDFRSDILFYWYEMLMVCIVRLRKPLYLMAGKFYIFSLETFGTVILMISVNVSNRTIMDI